MFKERTADTRKLLEALESVEAALIKAGYRETQDHHAAAAYFHYRFSNCVDRPVGHSFGIFRPYLTVVKLMDEKTLDYISCVAVNAPYRRDYGDNIKNCYVARIQLPMTQANKFEHDAVYMHWEGNACEPSNVELDTFRRRKFSISLLKPFNAEPVSMEPHRSAQVCATALMRARGQVSKATA